MTPQTPSPGDVPGARDAVENADRSSAHPLPGRRFGGSRRERERASVGPRRGRGEAIVRALTELAPALDRAYAARVAELAPAIESALKPEVMANRVMLADPSRPLLRLEPWRRARVRFRRMLLERGDWEGAVVMADVRSCYDSIEPGAVAAALARIGCPRDRARDLVMLLESLRTEGVPGLPVGPRPSAVVANAVLAGPDDALRRSGFWHLRWVDDVVAFTAPAHATRALAVLRFALAELGLELAEGKTRVLLGPDPIARAIDRHVPSALPPAVTLRGDADVVPGDARAHPLVSPNG